MTPKAPVIRAGVLPLKPFSLAQFRNDHAITDENRPLIAAEPRKANLSFNLAIRSTTIPGWGGAVKLGLTQVHSPDTVPTPGCIARRREACDSADSSLTLVAPAIRCC
jgi:hypothetical protein